jgi:hypothetical protein
MALLIQKNIAGVLGTLDVSTLYLRLQSHLKYSGTEINAYNKIYLDKSSYLCQQERSNVEVSGIPNSLKFNYDRNSDGVDILILSHNKFIDYLTTDITKITSTIDPSTGQIVYSEEIITPKFCESSEISIIDVSIL